MEISSFTSTKVVGGSINQTTHEWREFSPEALDPKKNALPTIGAGTSPRPNMAERSGEGVHAAQTRATLKHSNAPSNAHAGPRRRAETEEGGSWHIRGGLRAG